jgi:hypothetical protein
MSRSRSDTSHRETHRAALAGDDKRRRRPPQRNARRTSQREEREKARLDGNDLLHATFTRPDWRTAPTKHTHRHQNRISFLFFFFYLTSSFFRFFHSLTIPNGETPWRDDATAPAPTSLSLLFRINIRKGERESDGRGNRKKSTAPRTPHETPVGAPTEI